MNTVLDKLKVVRLILDIDKCEFKQKRVKYLGYIVDADEGVIIDPDKVEAINN